MGALDHAVRSGKALYAGISNYNAEQAEQAIDLLRQMGTPMLIHQPKYNMFERAGERALFPLLAAEGVGCIPFCPLAQGLLTNRYLQGVPTDARAARVGYLADDLTVYPGDGSELLRPIREVVRPPDPGGFMRFPLGWHAVAAEGLGAGAWVLRLRFWGRS